jgi:hypothetical protein
MKNVALVDIVGGTITKESIVNISKNVKGYSTYPGEIQERILSCAYLFACSKLDIIARLADKLMTDMLSASVRYTMRAMKVHKAMGMNAYEAIEAVEERQTATVDQLANAVNRYNAGTTGLYRAIQRINGINRQCETLHTLGTLNDQGRGPDYYNVLDGLSYPHYPDTRKDGVKVRNTMYNTQMGKVMGSLYTEWESRTQDTDIAKCMMDPDTRDSNAIIADNIRRYMLEYSDRVSPTAKQLLCKLVELDNETVASLTTRKGRSDSYIAVLYNKIMRLHKGFPAAKGVSVKGFIKLIRKYLSKGDLE